jgi:spermidine/putrescine transport system ATP-binding protein
VVTAVDSVDLTIGEGEFFSLLGPSGCGKTTTLRMIGGFEEPSEGQILLYGNDVVGVPPNHRDVNMVFQSYALFPHMSVYENVAFGLRRKGVDTASTKQRVGEMLELVQLEGKSDRRPRELSGGQQQRVALARALVNKPRALLLDEPLAALDLKLRQAMQLELKRIQREVGITFIFVTHDQNEALTMSDRLVVMNAGKIEQLGSPREIYERPRTRFVAGFIGTSNIITGTVREMDGTSAVLETTSPDETLVVADAHDAAAEVGKPLHITVRPEKISISTDTPAPGRCAIRGTVSEVVYLGTSTQYAVRTMDDTELLVFLQNSSDPDDIAHRGQEIWLSWRPDHSLAIAVDSSDADVIDREAV